MSNPSKCKAHRKRFVRVRNGSVTTYDKSNTTLQVMLLKIPLERNQKSFDIYEDEFHLLTTITKSATCSTLILTIAGKICPFCCLK